MFDILCKPLKMKTAFCVLIKYLLVLVFISYWRIKLELLINYFLVTNYMFVYV